MAVTPNGRTLYVLNSGSDTPIQVATNTAGIPIPVPHEPFILAVTPDGKTLYVTGGANLLIPIRTSTNHPGTPVAGRDQMPSPSPFFGASDKAKRLCWKVRLIKSSSICRAPQSPCCRGRPRLRAAARERPHGSDIGVDQSFE